MAIKDSIFLQESEEKGFEFNLPDDFFEELFV